MFNQGQQNVNIKQLLLIATRTYKPIYNRTYTLNTTNATLQRMCDMARPDGTSSRRIMDTHIAKFVPEIINMDPVVSGEVKIPHGWSTERLRFLMEVEYGYMGTNIVAYIQGFTEFHDPSYSDKIDPNMKFYINSITTVIKQVDPVTGILTVRPYDSYNVLTNIEGENYPGIQSSYDKVIRPQDIFNNYYLEEKYNIGEDSINNVSDELAPNKVLTSRKINNNPLNYMARGIEAYRSAQVSSDVSWDTQSIMDNAKVGVAEPSISNNPFIFNLMNLTGMLSPSHFTYNMLMSMDPGIISKTKKFNREFLGTVEQYNTFLDSDNTNETIQPTIENMKAAFLANIIPSLCIECLITDCNMSITNAGGQPTVIITSANSMIEDINMISFIDKLELRINDLVIPKLTEFNQLLVEAHISCNIIGDFTVGISIGGHEVEIFRYPAYADSLYTPMITNNVNQGNLLNNFHNVLDATYGVMSQDVTNKFPYMEDIG